MRRIISARLLPQNRTWTLGRLLMLPSAPGLRRSIPVTAFFPKMQNSPDLRRSRSEIHWAERGGDGTDGIEDAGASADGESWSPVCARHIARAGVVRPGGARRGRNWLSIDA